MTIPANLHRPAFTSLVLLLLAPAAWGDNCTATGSDAACRGDGSDASGNISTAVGSQVVACKGNSSAYGLQTQAESDNSFVVGRFNAIAGSHGQCADVTFKGQPPLFVVGNGTGPHGPISERRKNALTVLENGTTVIGTLRSPETDFGPFAVLNVVGNSFISHGLTVGQAGISVGRDGGTNTWRNMSFWTALARNGASCETGCGHGVCLAAYLDTQDVNRTSCTSTQFNKNCVCIGRP